jgi:Fic family protein
MKEDKPDSKPAKTISSLRPYLPGRSYIGPLKDLAQEVASASAALEGRVARATADVLGRHLRLINSYYSNLIEGHKTTIPDIQMALQKNFHDDPEKKYAQQLCAAHVETEKEFMAEVERNRALNISSFQFLSSLHRAFYNRLPQEHRFSHTLEGFSDIPVNPGMLRDVNVSVDGRTAHGPGFDSLFSFMKEFEENYNPDRFHGDERLIAMAASHHRLTWLHPFRDGNGRVARLFSNLFLTRAGINQSNLWSLARGLSRQKQRYMMELWATDSPEEKKGFLQFNEELLADFCEFFLRLCLDQIGFMENLLGLDQIEARIDWYVDIRSKSSENPLRPESSRLLRAVFMRGQIARGRAGEILNMSQRNARRIVAALADEGLIVSQSHRAPLVIGLPLHVLPYYFPDLYDPSVIGY